MATRRGHLFLARHSYRVRRLRDAAGLLPFLGVFLLLLPLLWEGPEGKPRSLAADAIFVFCVWFGLILMAAGLARGLRSSTKGDDPAGTGDGDA